MALYDIVFHTGEGHEHFLNGGIIMIKSHNSVWTSEELNMGTKAVINFTDNELNEVTADLLSFKVNDNDNPSNHVRGS